MKKLNIYVLIILFFIILLSELSFAFELSSGTVYTEDNIKIAYDLYETGSNSVIIVCPGFYNSKENKWMRRTAEIISAKYDVIVIDFRGHGKSEGKYTWSAKEHMDVNAILDLALEKGYEHIGIVAFSLGAASAINAVAERSDVESMILISCPTKFKSINYHFWEFVMFYDLKDNIDCGWQGKGARTGHIFMPKKTPISSVGSIKNTAIFFISGDKDWVIKETNSEKLFDAANIPKKYELIKNGLHAERLIQFNEDLMQNIILDWFSETLG